MNEKTKDQVGAVKVKVTLESYDRKRFNVREVFYVTEIEGKNFVNSEKVLEGKYFELKTMEED